MHVGRAAFLRTKHQRCPTYYLPAGAGHGDRDTSPCPGSSQRTASERPLCELPGQASQDLSALQYQLSEAMPSAQIAQVGLDVSYRVPRLTDVDSHTFSPLRHELARGCC